MEKLEKGFNYLFMIVWVSIPLIANIFGNKPTWDLWIYTLLAVLVIRIIMVTDEITEYIRNNIK